MSALVWIAAGLLLGYALGAVPVGYWVCRIFGVNILKVGSGKTGATNAWRAAGLKAGLPTLVGDALKGAAAILTLRSLIGNLAPDLAPDIQTLALALAGGMAVIGHNWSVFLGFRGGAGGMTCALTGVFLFPTVGIMAIVAGAIIYYWSRIASFATFSVAVTSLAGYVALALFEDLSWAYMAFPILSLIAVALALQPNREKLRLGEERVVTLW